MNISPLTVLRLAAPNRPTLREVAQDCEVSATTINMFEMGRARLNDTHLARYAKCVGATVREVRRRFLEAQLGYHEGMIREVRDQLRALGHPKKKLGRPARGVS